MLIYSWLVTKFPTFYGTTRFITVQKSSQFVCILDHTNPTHAIPSHVLRSILMLTSHLCLSLSSSFFLSVLPSKSKWISLHHICTRTNQSSLILFYSYLPNLLSKLDKNHLRCVCVCVHNRVHNFQCCFLCWVSSVKVSTGLHYVNNMQSYILLLVSCSKLSY
jgi:hypothetical protein